MSSPCSSLLDELERETHLKTLAPQMMSGRLQGRILSLLSKLVGPEQILEIGTFTGYGTLCLAEGLGQNGKITTIEVNPELTAISEKYFEASEFKDKIKAHSGDAIELIPSLSELYNLVYIDAGKKDNAQYLELILPRLNPGGIILIDNVLWAGKVLDPNTVDIKTQTIQAFNKMISEDERLEVVLIPIRDGLSVLRKR
jgi:predicted O-methyltransferase YrrM